MTVTEPTQQQPPEAELQFDIGATDDSLDRMIELFARYGDTYRAYQKRVSMILPWIPNSKT